MTKTVKSEKQLDSLPAGTILRDREGDAWQKGKGGEFWLAGGSEFIDSCYVAEFHPIQVIWEGEAE